MVATSAELEPSHTSAVWGSENPGPDCSLLVVGGLLLRQLAIDGRRCSELLGPGDVIRPWDGSAVVLPVEQSLGWRVVKPTRVVFLDRRFLSSASPWPEVLAAVVTRAVRRAQSLAAHLTISTLTPIEDRVWLLFWHFADRWGRVTPDGVRLDLPLTHELLAELVGARRPTVTRALTNLSRRNALRRNRDGSWLLAVPREPRHGPGGSPRA